jgi:hypothetical protein
MGLFTNRHTIVEGLAAVVPSTSTPDYISLKNVHRITAVITAKNATTVTGSAVTLKQASAVAGTGEKALAFSRYRANADTGASDLFTDATATSNTFTMQAVNSKNAIYTIDIDPATLDQANGFDCVRVGVGDATAQTVSVYYIVEKREHGGATEPSVIVD